MRSLAPCRCIDIAIAADSGSRFSIASIEVNREMQIGTEVWPVWPIILMIPVSFALMMLEMLRLLWVAIRNFGKSPARQHAAVEIG